MTKLDKHGNRIPDPHCRCSRCASLMDYQYTIEDYAFDWQGNQEYDDDGLPFWEVFDIYACSDCGKWTRVFVRYFS